MDRLVTLGPVPPPPASRPPLAADDPAASPDHAVAAALARVAAGEDASLGHLYDLTSARAHQLALAITRGDQEAAADLICAAYRAIWLAAPTWHETSLRPLSWVLGVVRDAGGAGAVPAA